MRPIEELGEPGTAPMTTPVTTAPPVTNGAAHAGAFRAMTSSDGSFFVAQSVTMDRSMNFHVPSRFSYLSMTRPRVFTRMPTRIGRTNSKPAVVPAGKPLEYRIDIWDIAHTVLKGHRLRIAVSSSDTPTHEALPEPALNYLFHSGDFPSKLLVTVR